MAYLVFFKGLCWLTGTLADEWLTFLLPKFFQDFFGYGVK